MKKFLVVLTILVLVAGFAFAGISGKVTASYTVGFADFEGTGAISAGKDPVSKSLLASFTLDSQKLNVTAENMPHVELEITASLDYFYEDSRDHVAGAEYTNNGFKETAVKIATFKIVGEDWSVNLLNAEDAKLDLAKSAVDSVKFHAKTLEENTQYFSMKKDIKYTDGFSVNYKDYVVGIGFNTDNFKNSYAAITLEVKTPEFVFDAVKVQAGAGFSQAGYKLVGGDQSTKAYVASAKVAYDADIKASVAADFSKQTTDSEAKYDVAANLQVAPVTVDVYFANSAQVTSSKTPKNTVSAENLLSAKAVVDVAKIAENVPVTLTVKGIDLLNRYDNVAYYDSMDKTFGKIVDVEVMTTIVKDFKFTVTGGDLLNKTQLNLDVNVVYTGIQNLELEGDVNYTFDSKNLVVNAKATYKAEMYKAIGEIIVTTDFEDALLGLSASVETDKLVEGATLKAEWSGFGFGYKLDSTKTSVFGALTVSCAVEF